jgi:hypothetical protein
LGYGNNLKFKKKPETLILPQDFQFIVFKKVARLGGFHDKANEDYILSELILFDCVIIIVSYILVIVIKIHIDTYIAILIN